MVQAKWLLAWRRDGGRSPRTPRQLESLPGAGAGRRGGRGDGARPRHCTSPADRGRARSRPAHRRRTRDAREAAEAARREADEDEGRCVGARRRPAQVIAYFDTSAVVPLLVQEPATSRAIALWEGADRVAAVRLVYPEARAALAQAHRLDR